jgi:ferredoxin--NADP+ reductase
VIGTNKKDAAETADRLLEDARAGLLGAEGGDLEELLLERGVEFVEYSGWESIDEHERRLGEPHGRPRVKLVSWDELLASARSASGRRLDSKS